MAEHALDGVTATPKAQLPEALAAELNRWAEQFAHDAGAGTRDALAQAEENLEGLRTQLESVTQARDEALADAAEQGEAVERLTIALNDARQVASNALVGKAKDQLAIEGKDAQLAELRQQIERNVASSAALSDARLAAEMELVGAATARDNFAAEIKELRAQLASKVR
jgi:chromosome segregation ATPase